MPEIADRLVENELSRMPAANSWQLLHTATATDHFTMGVCNGVGVDAHISVALIGIVESAAAAWVNGMPAPPYTVIANKQLIESDATTGNIWEMPTCVLRVGERIAIFTDVLGVTFNPHGFKMIADTGP